MHVEVVLPLIDGLLIKNWGRTDNSITCANIKCAALIIETLKLMSVSVGFFRFFFKTFDANSKSRVCRVFRVVFCD